MIFFLLSQVITFIQLVSFDIYGATLNLNLANPVEKYGVYWHFSHCHLLLPFLLHVALLLSTTVVVM